MIGPDRCVLSTDHGKTDNESLSEACGSFVDALRATGLGEAAIEAITVETSGRLLSAEYDE